jgi:hypothetical protein
MHARKKPTNKTAVRGATVLALRGVVPVRSMETTRTECSGRLLASLWRLSLANYGSIQLETKRAHLPNNVPNVVDPLFVVAREYT